ncbi:hypothetical protein HK44_004475 [Pseudomonas fluorescens HK44]|uniref:Uncharacterized protein n=1 Tax=Pseudomonas fluorescens HK44 TaxID=1042209 RepID=A0A010RNJ6_PSEFL|nr:hypothetical protein [Pseudomonas fluorescens]EXF94081.1 hypothetical protein HK44_004475 [Pseudomonas fluorescens HK44]
MEVVHQHHAAPQRRSASSPPGGKQDGQFRQAHFQTRAVPTKRTESLCMIRQFRAMNPGQEWTVQVAPGPAEDFLENGAQSVIHLGEASVSALKYRETLISELNASL